MAILTDPTKKTTKKLKKSGVKLTRDRLLCCLVWLLMKGCPCSPGSSLHDFCKSCTWLEQTSLQILTAQDQAGRMNEFYFKKEKKYPQREWQTDFQRMFESQLADSDRVLSLTNPWLLGITIRASNPILLDTNPHFILSSELHPRKDAKKSHQIISNHISPYDCPSQILILNLILFLFRVLSYPSSHLLHLTVINCLFLRCLVSLYSVYAFEQDSLSIYSGKTETLLIPYLSPSGSIK